MFIDFLCFFDISLKSENNFEIKIILISNAIQPINCSQNASALRFKQNNKRSGWSNFYKFHSSLHSNHRLSAKLHVNLHSNFPCKLNKTFIQAFIVTVTLPVTTMLCEITTKQEQKIPLSSQAHCSQILPRVCPASMQFPDISQLNASISNQFI